MAFYNEKLSVWEYLLEPVLENERIKMWNLDLQVVFYRTCTEMYFLSEIPYETEDILYIYINMTLINIVKILDMFSL